MVFTVALGVKSAFQGLSVDVKMGAQGITSSCADKTMVLFQLGAVEVTMQRIQEKAAARYKGRNSVDYMKIKVNFFSPHLM